MVTSMFSTGGGGTSRRWISLSISGMASRRGLIVSTFNCGSNWISWASGPRTVLKYAEPHRLRTVLGPLAHDIQFDPQLKVLTIRPRLDAMPEIERLIQRLDVPPPPVENIDVTIYLMSALAQPAASATPAELETVVKQLKSMFSYKGYQL